MQIINNKLLPFLAVKTKVFFQITLLFLMSLTLVACGSSGGDDDASTDNINPVITLLGSNPFNLSVGDAYTDPGATASDDVDGNITSSIVVGGDTVDTAVVDTFVVTYNVSDASGNAAPQVTRTVNVVNDSPVINSFTISPDPAFVNASATFNWDVSDDNGDTLTCLLDIDNDGTDDFTINDCANNTSQINAYTVAGDVTAQLTVGDGIAPPVVQTINFTVIAPLATDLVLSSSTDPVTPNETFTYKLDFGNTSAGLLSNTELRTSLPAGVTVISASDGGVEVSVGEVIWSVGSLAVGDSLHREITVTADAGLTAGKILPASAQLTHDGGQAVDNTAEHAITVVSNALPLQVDISTSANPVIVNDRVLYTLTVSNSSALAVSGVNVQLRVPAELSFLGTTDVQPDPTGCGTTCTPTQEPTWSLGTLAAGESRTITVNALVDNVSNGNLITVPVRVTATDVADTINLLNTVAIFSSPSADLALSASTDAVVANETFTYKLDFGNTSGVSLTTVALRAFLPAGVTVSSISDGGIEVSVGEVVWSVATVNSGVSIHREITVVADGAEAGDILKLYVELTHDNKLEIDNRSEFAVSVAKNGRIASLLSVDILATPDPIASNGTLNYTITVTNNFGLPVADVVVKFRVPEELFFHQTTDVEPNPTGCSTNCSPGQEASWVLGTMAAGTNQVITINATVAAGLADATMISVPVRVTASGMEDTINLQHTTVIQN